MKKIKYRTKPESFTTVHEEPESTFTAFCI